MRKIDIKSTFKKDYKRVLKQGWNESDIDDVIKQLISVDELDEKLRDHPLQGIFKDFRSCHIYGDLVIIYSRTDQILSLYRIGRHQDIYKNY